VADRVGCVAGAVGLGERDEPAGLAQLLEPRDAFLVEVVGVGPVEGVPVVAADDPLAVVAAGVN